MDIERAKELLAAASPWPWTMEFRGEYLDAYVMTGGTDIMELGLVAADDAANSANSEVVGRAPATLAALILAVVALSCDRVVASPCRKVRPDAETWCDACKALAAWEKL